MMVLGGISQFFPASMSSIIIGAYVIIFGVGRLRSLVMSTSISGANFSTQLSPVWSLCPTSPTMPTVTLPSFSLSLAAVSVSYDSIPWLATSQLTSFLSLHLRWLHPAARSGAALHCRLHCRSHRCRLPRPRVHSLH